MSSNTYYQELLNQVDTSDNGPRKKRKVESISLDSDDVDSHGNSNSDSDSDEFEDVSLDIDDSFEQVNLEQPKSPVNDSITIEIKKPEPKKKKMNVISSEERSRRVLIHKMYLVMLLIHGTLRNKWCNDKELAKTLVKSCVTQQIIGLLRGDDKSEVINSRRLLDGLKKLMTIYSAKLRITSQGLIRKDWHELSVPQKNDSIVNRKNFKKLVTNFRGSRDVGAQGFVTLLRGLGLNARLILSMQPPDFTVISNTSKEASSMSDSTFPIFWVEVWDKYLKRWISIDPIVMKVIEICPKRRKCSFEPPSSDERNQLTYVIGYDKYGRVRDITRRYSLNYNAKTIRKRIEFRSSHEKDWYELCIKCCNFKKTNSLSDIYESKEFNERDLNEGMPNNIQSFRNHPLYVLENQIHSNEIIHPQEKCGTFKSRNKLINVYKRSNVHRLRSAKAWYLRGRILKIGQQPMKVISKDEEVRLYAEFQTQLYIPPPIENGIVPKNQYGNIDLYSKTMLPENGALIETTPEISMKLLIQAANIVSIDYAKAIVAFDFGRKKSVNVREGGIVIFSEYKEAIDLVVNQLLSEVEEAKRILIENSALNNWKYFLLKLRLEYRLNKSHGVLDADAQRQENSDNDNVEELNFVEDKMVKQGNFDQPDESDQEDSGGFIASGKKLTDELDINDGFVVTDDSDQEYKKNSGFIVSDTELAEDDEGGFILSDHEQELEIKHGGSEVSDLPDRKAKANKQYYQSDEENNDSSDEADISVEDDEFEYESE